MKKFLAAALLSLALTGCAALGSAVSTVAVSATTAPPTQAKTVAEATQIMTAAEKALDLYVRVGNPSRAVLRELQILVPAVHNALVAAETANAKGDSALTAAALAGFNEAWGALRSYETLQGVPH